MKIFLSEKLEEVFTYPIINYILSLSRSTMILLQESFQFYMNNYNLRTLFEIILARMNIYVSTTIRILDFWYNSGQLLSFKFDYDSNSHLNYNQILPIYWNKFRDVPSFMIFGHTQEEKSTFDITLFYMQMHNIVREFLTAITTKTLLPPFMSTAMIIGDNIIQTFDGFHYMFDGNCSYVLTKDFNHGRFEVRANFENFKKESISILVEEGDFILQNTGKVLWNGQLLELPLIYNDVFIKREENKITFLTKKGFKAECNIVSESCIFQISGWYFGKVGGLLGVYDNEPSNDLMTPSRIIYKNVHEFVDSWKASEECVNNQVTNFIASSVEWDIRKCEHMFESEESKLLPCFGVINPAPYKQMCLQQMENMKHNPTSRRGFCQLAGAYIDYCKVNSLAMWLPEECYMCESPKSAPIKGGAFQDFFNDSGTKSTDVVIVTQHGSCLDEFDFKTIFNLIELSLEDVGLRDNQYTIVGYGGQGNLEEPHTYTSNGDVFNKADFVSETLSR